MFAEFPKDWETGMPTLLHKNGNGNEMWNYRPMALLIAIYIYKIWATIVTKRLIPITNLLTNDNQCAYKTKTKRSTSGAIFYIGKQFVNNEIKVLIAFDISEAFGRINRGWICGVYFT